MPTCTQPVDQVLGLGAGTGATLLPCSPARGWQHELFRCVQGSARIPDTCLAFLPGLTAGLGEMVLLLVEVVGGEEGNQRCSEQAGSGLGRAQAEA